MAPVLRLACLGDSWVSDWAWGCGSNGGWGFRSPLTEALCDGLSALGHQVEIVLCGLPGYTSERVLELANLCRLRDLASLLRGSGDNMPRGNLAKLLSAYGVARYSSDGAAEDVDAVLVIAGYNDLRRGDSPRQIARRLLQIRELYQQRGVEALVVSVGEGRPHLERWRRRVNAQLMAGDPRAIDCDELLLGLDNSNWEECEHFTEQGSRVVGKLLAQAVAVRLGDMTSVSHRNLGLKKNHAVGAYRRTGKLVWRKKEVHELETKNDGFGIDKAGS